MTESVQTNIQSYIAGLKRLLETYAFSPIEKQKLRDEITELEKIKLAR